MKKLLKKWLGSIAVSLFAVLLFVIAGYANDLRSAGREAGKGTANTALDRFDSREELRGNVFIPMTSEGVQMRTIDGLQEFDAQLICPSSDEFLKIFVQPSGTGDLSQTIISIDTNLDSRMDYSYRVPFVVSGVCGNGIISCNAGTWANCRYYKWVADNDVRVRLREVALTDLGGCYCINSSCGSNLVWTNLPIVLRDIGGGIAGALQSVNPQYAVSDVRIDGTTILYFGQRVGGCGPGDSARIVSQQQYRTNWAQMTADRDSMVLSQSADPKSFYSMLTGSLAAQKTPSEMSTCLINRSISCVPDSTNFTENISNLCSRVEADPTCKLRDERVDNVVTYRNYNPTRLSPLQLCRQLTCVREATCGESVVFDETYAVGNLKYWSPCGSGTSFGHDCITSKGLPGHSYSETAAFIEVMTEEGIAIGCPLGYELVSDSEGSSACVRTGCAESPSPLILRTKYVVAGNAITATASIIITRHPNRRAVCWGRYSIAIVNSAGYAVAARSGRGGCGSYGDTVVYVPTVSGNYTVKIWMVGHMNYGAWPSHCRATIRKIRCPLDETLPCVGSVGGASVCTQSVTHNVCRNWWNKDRTYLCQAEPFDFSAIRKRAGHIQGTIVDNTTNIYYQDMRKDESGNWITENRAIELGVRGQYGPCEEVCKVRRPREIAQVGVGGHAGQQKTIPRTYDFFYKPCLGNVCPVGAGEEIVKNCQCINEFAEAASIMQILRMAGRDMICSDGRSKPLR